GDYASGESEGLEKGQVTRELHGSGFAEAAHEVNRPTPDLANDDRHCGTLDRLGVDGGQVVLELLHSLTRRLDLAGQRQRGFSARSHADDLMQLLVLP